MATIKRSVEVRLSKMTLEKMPADLLGVLGEEEKAAVAEGGLYFRRLADRTKRKDLKKLLGLVEAVQPITLYMDSVDEGPFTSYFGFTLMAAGGVHPKLRLASQMPDLPFPNSIREIYETIGGFREPWADYAGLVATHEIRSIEQSGVWLSDENEMDPKTAFVIYRDGSGDLMGFDAKGFGFRYNHEEGLLEKMELEEFLEDYFVWSLERA